MITPSKYKDKDSLVLENKMIRAEVLPNPGGKVASFINKETGYEYMLQRPNKNYKDQSFGGSYIDGECSGFDDMFPTIDECSYQDPPWSGIKMMDHGEVWSLPWDYEISESKLKMKVKGLNFPYSLEKHFSFIKKDELRIEYKLNNLSSESFEFLWAGHLMINMIEGTRLEVPKDCKEAVRILSNSKGNFGDIHQWPYIMGNDGIKYRADISRHETSKGFEKYFFNNKLSKGWCKLIYPDQRNMLTVRFSQDTVPYLGVLMNEKGWDNIYNIIIEPCTVCYDRPDIAKKYGQVSKVSGGGKYEWYVELKI